MINSILNSVKKILNIDFAYTPFDAEIIMHINAVFSVLHQLGIGPEDGFYISDDDDKWDDYQVPTDQLNLIKIYMGLKVRLAFDPPATSYLIDAMNKQIEQYEWRLSVMRESALAVLLEETVPEEVV